MNVIGFDVDAKTRDQLKAISEAGGGKYFPAKDSSALRKQLDAAHRQEAELARYKYCMALNVGYAGVVYHNAKINLSGCYLRESKRNKLEYITQQIKAFDTDEKKACAPKIKQLLSADDVKERNWFIETNTRLNNDNKTATDAVHEKSVFHNILTK